MNEAHRLLSDLYDQLEARVVAGSPVCRRSGRCCNFSDAGHDLMATDLEVDYALRLSPGPVPRADSGRCPWHVDGLCELRDGRPLGCRIYFCDPAWTDLMHGLYETFHAQLRELHERFGLPYAYRRFVQAVRVPAGTEPPP